VRRREEESGAVLVFLGGKGVGGKGRWDCGSIEGADPSPSFFPFSNLPQNTQAREDRLANLEYERALKEFYALDDPTDRAQEEALDRSLSLSQR